MKQLILSLICAASLGACANAGIGIAIPLGPFGSIGVGVNGAGQITGNLGVGGHIGSVGIGGGTSFPIGNLAPPPVATTASTGTTAVAAPVKQTGASQNVPR